MVLTEWSHADQTQQNPRENPFNDYIQRTQLEGEMTLHYMGVSAIADSKGADQGWNQLFDKLAESMKEMST